MQLFTRLYTRLLVERFVRNESGATAIEYGMIAALIAAVVIGTISAIGGNLDTAFTNINSEL